MVRVRLLTIGSTLASQATDVLAHATYRLDRSVPLLTPAEIIERVPEISRFAQMEPDQDWSNRTPPVPPLTMWRELGARLQELFDTDEGLTGAIVIHGTNVLEETAYFLHLTLKTEKPVILVGAQRPITTLSSDGQLNLVNAVRTIAHPDSGGRGVMVLLNDQIHSARDVVKTSTYRLETFQAPSLGPIGVADPDRVLFYHRHERRHTTATPFDILNLGDLPRVDILYDYHGSDGALIPACLAAGAKGIVVAGAGAGAVGGMRDALEAAAGSGVAVVRSNRVGSGRVAVEDNYAFPGSIAADDLNPQKARVLLMLALTRTQDPAEIQRMFTLY